MCTMGLGNHSSEKCPKIKLNLITIGCIFFISSYDEASLVVQVKTKKGPQKKYGSKCLELSNLARNAKISKNCQKEPKA